MCEEMVDLVISLYEEMKEIFQKRQLQEQTSLETDCWLGVISKTKYTFYLRTDEIDILE